MGWTNQERPRRGRLSRPMVPLALLALSAPLAGEGCSNEFGAVCDLTLQCGLVCPVDGVREGNSSVSSLTEIDAYFGAVIDLNGATRATAETMRAELDAIAVSVGLDAGATGAELRQAIETRVADQTTSLLVRAAPARCEVSPSIAAGAAAMCDAVTLPDEAPRCEGTCAIDRSTQAECAAEGSLTCRGQAVGLACAGTCSGECVLTTEGACDGACHGVCSGVCSAKDPLGNCVGACQGTCQGSCVLAAGGSCEGACLGVCDAPSQGAACPEQTQPWCTTSGGSSVACLGGCEGSVVIAAASPVCPVVGELSATARAACTSPPVQIGYQASAAQGAAAQADLAVWTSVLEARLSKLLSESARASRLTTGWAHVVASASEVVTDLADQAAETEDIWEAVGVGCALSDLPNVGSVEVDATNGLTEQIARLAEVLAALGSVE